MDNQLQQQIIDALADIAIMLHEQDEPSQEDVDFWTRFVSTSYKWESRFIQGYAGKEGIAKLFIRQGLDAVARIEGRKSFSAGLPRLHIEKINADGLINWEQYEILFEEFGQLLLPLIAADYGSKELTRLVVGISFDVVNPEVIEFARDYSVRFAKSVNEETLKLLSAELREADELGESIPQITKRVRLLFAGMTKKRAYMIARTETMRAQNEGALLGYKASGVVEAKRWLAIDDLRTCSLCHYMNGRILGLDGTWFEQGSSITLPKLSGKGTETFTFNYEAITRPPAHPHDRCCLSPVVTI